MKRYVLYILMILILPAVSKAQLIDEQCLDFTRVMMPVVSAAGTPYTLPLENPYQNSLGFSINDVYAEIALIYYKTQRSDLTGKEWSLVIDCDILDSNMDILNSGTIELSLTNDENHARHISVSRLNNMLSTGKIFCKINSFSFTSPDPNTTLPPDIGLELRLIYTNSTDIEVEETNDIVISYDYSPSKNIINDQVTGKSIVHLNWTDVNADYYEVYYVFVDELDGSNYQTNLNELFKNQALSVETIFPYLDLDVSYPKGTLYVAVRPIGKLGQNSGVHLGDWDYGNVIEIELDGFEPNLNWSFEKSFAEEGKSKKNVQFFDKSLRPQQLITNLNSENTVLVSESDYDLEGRATIQVLPAPVQSLSEINHNELVNYYFKPGFNIVRNEVGEFIPFNFTHHEKNTATDLSPLRGAEKYFSAGNQLDVIHKDYIPFSEGAPFVQTKYKNDNTGRLSEQSGVGKEFKIGVEYPKTTKYYYLTPDKTELLQMFGTDIGHVNHYQKNLTKDPNGQMSVNYTDMTGATIATFLYGPSPSNVVSLEGNLVEKENKVTKLPVNQVVTPNSTYSSYTFFNPNEDPVTVNVDLSYLAEKAFGQTTYFCVTCPYVVTFYLTGPDGIRNEITSLDIDELYGLDGKLPAETCPVPSPQQLRMNANTQITLNKGSGYYTIEKELFSSFEISSLKSSVNHLVIVNDIREEISSQFDDCHCEISCEDICGCHDFDTEDYESCMFNCGEGLNDIINEIMIASCDNNLFLLTDQIKDELIRDIVLPDMVDVSACLGQMGVPRVPIVDIDGVEFMFDPEEMKFYDEVAEVDQLSIVISNGMGGTLTLNPENGNMYDVFAFGHSAWQEGFYTAYLGCHREFCHYKKCKQKNASAGFDNQIKLLKNIDESFTEFSVDPNNLVSRFEELFDNMILEDPFYTTNFCDIQGVTATVLFQSLLTNYSASIADENICGAINSIYSQCVENSAGACSFSCVAEYLFNEYYLPADIVDGTTPEERIWNFILASYQTFKERVFSNSGCHSCEYQTDEHIIYEKTVTDDYTYEDIKMNMDELLDQAGDFSNEESCEGRVEVLIDFFNEHWAKDEDPTESDLTDPLSILCQQECALLAENTTYETTLESPGTIEYIDPCGNGGPCTPITCFWPEGTCTSVDIFGNILGPLTQQNCLPSIRQFTSGPVNLSTDGNNSAASQIDGLGLCTPNLPIANRTHFTFTYQKVGRYNRLVIHTDNTIENPMKDLKVRIVEQICNNENNVQFNVLVYNATQNMHGDIILNYETIGQSSLITVDIYSSEIETLSLPFAFELNIQDSYFSSSEFYNFHETSPTNIIHLKSLKDVHDQVRDIIGTEYQGVTEQKMSSFLSEAWDCEHACGEMNTCFETIIEKIQYYFNHFTCDNKSDQTTWSQVIANNEACFTRLAIHHYVSNGNYNWWIEVLGAPVFGNDPVLIRFLTREGLVPNFYSYLIGNNSDKSFLRMVDYKATYKNYSLLEHNPLLLTHNQGGDNEYFFPDVKFLFANEINEIDEMDENCIIDYESSSVFFQTAFMCIEKKLELEPTLVTSCDQQYDINDCRDLVSQMVNYLTEQEKNRQISTLLNEIIQVDCISGLKETFTKSWDDFQPHHFTLYYYDQVGNLVKTVPPAGVVLQPVIDGDLVTEEPADHNKITEYKYNSFNQIVWSNTPDADETRFYYDNLQRMRFSQNARQLALSTPRYSYTKYDDLSRVIEVGECEVSETQVIANINNAQWPNTIIDNIPTFDPVFTTYSEAVTSGFNHGVSRGRVAKVTRRNDPKDLNDDPVDITTLYRYDVHGNVNRIQQVLLENLTSEIEYDYDLINGNVKTVSYNPNNYDAFYHKYSYDADNRLDRVYTSQDRLIWNEDARYFYYLHGPLARVEYGDQKVQGLDYAYTMQGWIKTVNDAGKTAETEPGSDGFAHATNRNRWMGRDASAYTLGYFSNDYVSSTTLGMQPSIFAGEHQGLYNGNIAAMMTEHKGVGFDEAVSVYGYSYDQLHRLKKGTHYNFLNNSYTLSRKYGTEYTYDPDGNLEELQRTGNQMATLMDNLSYEYDLPDKPNQLKQVTDAATDANPGQFIGQEVYEYDGIGNLTKNTSNGVITEIEWDVYNKIKSVNSNSQLTKYLYDGAGNRIYSDVDGIQTGYVRDAQGNTMGIYNMTSEGDPFFWPQLKEVYLYGSSRFGVDRTFRTHPRLIIKNEWNKDLTTTRYEITNHLGNVLSTVTGRRLGQGQDGVVDHYLPEVATATDYYAFGQSMPGRTFENPDYTGTNDYRYAFNGKELDKSGEFGSLAHYDFSARIYNPSLGRFLSVDPLTANAPSWTPYRFAFNNPLYFIDPKGLFETKADAKSYAKSEGIKTGWLSSIFNGNRIEKHGDSWSIENKKEKTSIFQDKKLANEANPDGIFKSKYFTADRIKNTENHSLEGGTVIFGQDPAGVLEGAKPVSGGSYNSIDYPFIGIRNSWSAKSGHWLHYTAEWLSFFSTVNDLNNTFKQNQPNVAPYDMITRQAQEPEMRLKVTVFYNNTHENWPDFGKSDTIKGGHERWSNGNRDSISPIYFGRYNYGNKVGSRGESGKSEKLN